LIFIGDRMHEQSIKPGKRFLYNGDRARWWLRRSMDDSHQRAYRKIADFIRDSYRRAPGRIVDYACGAGNLLSLLSRRFANSRLVGLDGSSYLLGLAQRRLSRLPRRCSCRISLIETALPRNNLLRGQADLIIYCFPNMTPSAGERNDQAKKDRMRPDDWETAKRLAPKSPGVLQQSRTISYDLRHILVPGGICVRVEYAAGNRHEFSPADLQKVSFEEGSLDAVVEGRRLRPWFRVQASAYFRSRVLEDVYEQTGDERDRDGGYLITVLRAL
jgi:SAM-dependent methyltransferase